MKTCKFVSSVVIIVSLLGSTIAASAQAGGAQGPAAATASGSEVRAGEKGLDAKPGVTTDAATAQKEKLDESQYTVGDKTGRGPAEKPDAVQAAPAGR